MATVYGTLGIGLAHTIVTAIDQVNALNLNADEAERIAQAYNGREEELTKFVDNLKESGHFHQKKLNKLQPLKLQQELMLVNKKI